jgi:transposase
MKYDTIGVDVSKDHLDAHRLADGAARRFANDKRGHKALIEWLAERPADRVVFEPTGPYHRGVERALGESGVPFVKVNPRQARRFAEATGKLAKTDRLDAAMLARMGAVLELEARPARSEALLELRELYVAREALVKDRTAAKNRGKVLTLSLLKRHNERSTPRTDRSADRDPRSGNPPDCRSRREPRRSLRHPDQHSRHIQHHRLCPADRNAGTRRPRSRPGRQPRGPGPDRPPVRALDRSLIHSRRSRRRPPSALHARPRRRLLQSRHEG